MLAKQESASFGDPNILYQRTAKEEVSYKCVALFTKDSTYAAGDGCGLFRLLDSLRLQALTASGESGGVMS